jgi:hypothetical protein
LSLLGAFIVIVLAAFIAINDDVKPVKTPELLATIVLALAVVIQRINGVQRWLAMPKSRRGRLIEGIAQETLAKLCMDRVISDALLELRVHIWEVPIGYRKIFPYKLRVWLKRLLPKTKFPKLSNARIIRPTMKRLAAAGLQKQGPTGIRFKKGDGIIGLCVANNDRSEILSVDISSPEYEAALALTDEESWRQQGPDITRNLSLEDAKRLANSYGQVIARVIQDVDTGEAIGCVTISVRDTDDPSLQIVNDQTIKRSLIYCAMSAANSLA